MIVSYCSLCGGDRVEVWRVRQVLVTYTQHKEFYQVTVFAKKLFRPKKGFHHGTYKEPLEYERVPDGESSLTVEGVDLAYVYVGKPDGTFYVLAGEMKLQGLDCPTRKITLPKAVLAEALK